MRAYIDTRRVLHDGLGEIDLRPVSGSELFEYRDVGSIGIARHRQHLDPMKAQIAEHVVVAGIVDQCRVAGFEKIADDELERLAGALRQAESGLRWQ